MEKSLHNLNDLPDHIVLALRPNDYVSLWYHGMPVNKIGVTNGGPGKHHAKYRINTDKGQYRNDDPVIEFTYR